MTEKLFRREDERILTGKGRYTADWNLPSQLYAFVLRADRGLFAAARWVYRTLG